MKISTKCDKCNATFSVDDKFVGRKAKCSKCGADFIVQPFVESIPLQAPANQSPANRPAPSEADSTADADDGDFYTLAAKETANCTNCGKPLPAKAVLCVNCGYDFRTGTQMQAVAEVVLPKRGMLGKSKKQTKEKPLAKKFDDESNFPNQPKNSTKIISILVIVAGSVAIVWGAMALYGYLTYKWNANESYVRLDVILTDTKPKANNLAAELPYVYDYFQQLKATAPKYYSARLGSLGDAIPRIPKTADLTPLLQFPPNFEFYQEILDWIDRNTSLAWQMEKSCDSSENARHFAADALMNSLPFIAWTEADKTALRERTSLAEKESRFRKYADQSQIAAEKKLPGRFRVQIKAAYVNATHSFTKVEANTVKASTDTLGPVLDVKCQNRSWSVSFFGNSWSGPIEQLAHIDLECPIWDKRDLFSAFPFFALLKHASAHLRFHDGAFVVEMEGYPKLGRIGTNQPLQGFSDLEGVLVKASNEDAMLPNALVPVEVREKFDGFAEKLHEKLPPALQNLAEQPPGAKEVQARTSISELENRATAIGTISIVMDEDALKSFSSEKDKKLLDPAASPYIGSIAFTETITTLPGCRLGISWKLYYVYHQGKWTFLGVKRTPSRTDAESIARQFTLNNASADKKPFAAAYAAAIDYHAAYAQSFERSFAGHPISSLIKNIE